LIIAIPDEGHQATWHGIARTSETMAVPFKSILLPLATHDNAVPQMQMRTSMAASRAADGRGPPAINIHRRVLDARGCDDGGAWVRGHQFTRRRLPHRLLDVPGRRGCYAPLRRMPGMSRRSRSYPSSSLLGGRLVASGMDLVAGAPQGGPIVMSRPSID
jgi:hypothetical protein